MGGRLWLLKVLVAVVRAAPVSAKPRYHFWFRSYLQSIKNKEIDLKNLPVSHSRHCYSLIQPSISSTFTSIHHPSWTNQTDLNAYIETSSSTAENPQWPPCIVDEYPTSWSWSTVPCGPELTFFHSSLAILTLAYFSSLSYARLVAITGSSAFALLYAWNNLHNSWQPSSHKSCLYPK